MRGDPLRVEVWANSELLMQAFCGHTRRRRESKAINNGPLAGADRGAYGRENVRAAGRPWDPARDTRSVDQPHEFRPGVGLADQDGQGRSCVAIGETVSGSTESGEWSLPEEPVLGSW